MSQIQNANPHRRRWRIWIGIAALLFVVWLAVMYGFFAYWMDRELVEGQKPSTGELADPADQRQHAADLGAAVPGRIAGGPAR